MLATNPHRRVLITAEAPEDSPVRNLFGEEALHGWEVVPADSCERARFIMLHSPCDVLLFDDEVLKRTDEEGLAWLANQKETPVVLLGQANAKRLEQAYRQGVAICLPREITLAHPTLLAAALDRAYSANELRPAYRRLQEQLCQCRRHNDRLVTLFWRMSPRESDTRWFPQRYMMDRLGEELARSERHGLPLTLALGEVQTDEDPQEKTVADWAADRLNQAKRRCDVGGQYGLRGFMLLMVQTSKQGGVCCCQRLKKLLEDGQEQEHPGPRGPIRAYFGLASTPGGQGASTQSLLRCAEENLDTARESNAERIMAG